MSSQVSGLLKEAITPELQEALFRPALERDFPVVLPYMSQVNKAHIVMLARTGIIQGDVAQALARAVLELDRAGPGGFVLDPALEDPYFNYEARIIAMTGAEIGGRMHTGRSRNDLKATQDRLRARDKMLALMAGEIAVRRALLEAARQHAGVVMPGYTHLQPAQPITFGYYLLGLAQALTRDHDRLDGCYRRLNANPLGTGAMAGTSFPIDRDLTTALLGFPRLEPHAQDAVGSRDYLVELLGHCALMATTWGRLAQDFYVMTSYEFATLTFPDRIAGTSSMMPQKKNMVVLESLKARSATVLGAYVAGIAGQKGTNFTLTVDGARDSFRWAWSALDDTIESLTVLRIVVSEAEPRPARMLELVRANYSTATDLADALVSSGTLPFREAHHVVGAAVRLAIDRAVPADRMDAALIAEAAGQVLGRAVNIAQALVADAVDPVRAAERRAGTGGPAQSDMAAMQAALTERLDQEANWLAAERARIEAARARLETEFAALAGGPS
jgi:argininosuccinate lyase